MEVDEEALPPEEQKDRKIMKLLLKIKNGTPPMRKAALRQITDKARELGAGPLFNQILPLLMSPTLEDQERHLLVKVIDRVLYKLDDLVRPYVHKVSGRRYRQALRAQGQWQTASSGTTCTRLVSDNLMRPTWTRLVSASF